MSKEQKATEPTKKTKRSPILPHIIRVVEHLLLCVLAFAGVMSLVQADPMVKYAVAGVLTFILAKDTL